MTVPQTARRTLDGELEREWTRWDARGLARVPRPAWNRRGAEVETESGPAIDFSSNDYLGLATDARLVDAAKAALQAHGVGATASRLIAGTHPEHERLESEVAGFFGSPSSVVFTSGYSANAGAIPALVGPRDIVFADALNHASLIDACRLSRARVRVYEHADPDALRRAMRAERAAHRRALVVSDGLFSMDGDIAPIAALVELAREHDAWTYIDDAHAVGVLGPEGRGSANRLGTHGVDITVGTFGKAFGVAGAFIYGSPVVSRHLMNHARSFVFSTAMPPAQAAAAREALRVVAAEPLRRERVKHNARRIRAALASLDVRSRGDDDSHVVPVLIGGTRQTVELGASLRERGLLVGAVRPPTVAEGTSRLRISVSAAHTDAHVDGLVQALTELLPRS